MKRIKKRLSEELEPSTLLAMIDALSDLDLKDSTYCDWCGARVLRSSWLYAKYKSDYCQVCHLTGLPDRIEKERRDKEGK